MSVQTRSLKLLKPDAFPYRYKIGDRLWLSADLLPSTTVCVTHRHRDPDNTRAHARRRATAVICPTVRPALAARDRRALRASGSRRRDVKQHRGNT